MRDPVNPRRPYDAPRRRAAALATRSAILDAALRLFTEQGFVATTVDAIAARAGVSPESVYAVFGNKRTLLTALVDATIAGGTDAPPVAEQPWVAEMRELPDLRSRLAALARGGRAILERRTALDVVVEAAAATDHRIAALRERNLRQRHAGQRALLLIAIGDQPIRTGIDMEEAADTLFAIGSPEVYRLLMTERGWDGDRFEAWFADVLQRVLLDG
jgi:AcrR family transcriptional regulator